MGISAGFSGDIGHRLDVVLQAARPLRAAVAGGESLPRSVADEMVKTLFAALKEKGVDLEQGKRKGVVLKGAKPIEQLTASDFIQSGSASGNVTIKESGLAKFDRIVSAFTKSLHDTSVTGVAQKAGKAADKTAQVVGGRITAAGAAVGGALVRGGKAVAHGAGVAGAGVVIAGAAVAVGAGYAARKAGEGAYALAVKIEPYTTAAGKNFDAGIRAAGRNTAAFAAATYNSLVPAGKALAHALETADAFIQPQLRWLLTPVYNALNNAGIALHNLAKAASKGLGLDPYIAKAQTALHNFGVATRSLAVSAGLGLVYGAISATGYIVDGTAAAAVNVATLAQSAWKAAPAAFAKLGKDIKETFQSLPANTQKAAKAAYDRTGAALTAASEAVKTFGAGTAAQWNKNVQPRLNDVGTSVKAFFDQARVGFPKARAAFRQSLIHSGTAIKEAGVWLKNRVLGSNLTSDQVGRLQHLISEAKLDLSFALTLQTSVDSKGRQPNLTQDAGYKAAVGEGGIFARDGADSRYTTLLKLVGRKAISREAAEKELVAIGLGIESFLRVLDVYDSATAGKETPAPATPRGYVDVELSRDLFRPLALPASPTSSQSSRTPSPTDGDLGLGGRWDAVLVA